MTMRGPEQSSHARHIDGYVVKILVRQSDDSQYVVEHERGAWEILEANQHHEWTKFTPLTPAPHELWFAARPDQGYPDAPNPHDAFYSGPFTREVRDEHIRKAAGDDLRFRPAAGWYRYVLAKQSKATPPPSLIRSPRMTNERAGEFSDPVVSKFAALKAEMGERGVTPDLLARARARASRSVMSDRLSPGQVMAHRLMDLPGTVGLIGRMDLTVRDLIEALEAHGYVIVHSDDVPERAGPDGDPPGPDIPEDYTDEANYWAGWWSATGWNACRARILSGRASTEEER